MRERTRPGSILSSPALASAEKLGKSSLSAFFVLPNLRKRPPKDHYILERKSIFNIFFLSLCDCGIMNQTKGEKLMRRKILFLISILTISATLLSACKSADSVENSETIEATTIESEATEETEESKVELLPWLQLSSLETHPELRQAFEEFLCITGETGNKEGTLYYNPDTEEADQNATLYMATKNTAFKNYFILEDSMLKFGEIAAENYTDLEADDLTAPFATINAYFELLPDQAEAQFDGDATISRAQAMTLVMRATTPVNESQAPETDADFTSAVGESQYTNFAAPMNEFAYLNTENGLTESTFNTAMSKGEYICLLTNFLHADYLKYIEAHGYYDLYADTSDVTISTVSDAGDITFTEAISDATNGVPSDMYETFKVAIRNMYIPEYALEDWDSAITKADAINLFISMATNYTSIAGDGLVNDYSETSYTENPGYIENMEIIDEWGKKASDGDGIKAYEQYVISQGADYAMGWTWIYLNGKAAGNQPSYGVYMKEGDPLYGTVYHVGDYLPCGTQFVGTMEEFKALTAKEMVETFEEQGFETYEGEDGRIKIVVPDDWMD
ncbi:MAG: hypothetical protein ACI4F0_10925 [Agathobacter sp.]